MCVQNVHHAHTGTPNGTVNLFVCFHFLFSNEMKKFGPHFFFAFAHSNGLTHFSTNITELSVLAIAKNDECVP